MRTNMMTALVGLTVAGIFLLSLTACWPVINDVETGKTPEYPDLLPRTYEAKPELVFDAALHAIHRLPRWALVSHRPESGEIRAEATSRLFRFVDDVTITVRGEGGKAIVSVRSHSRVGKGDFGQNARNILAFFEELDAQLQRPSEHR
ncbi:MAG: DUF1499 domain-containing protein [Nitrospiraceae bacterium]